MENTFEIPSDDEILDLAALSEYKRKAKILPGVSVVDLTPEQWIEVEQAVRDDKARRTPEDWQLFWSELREAARTRIKANEAAREAAELAARWAGFFAKAGAAIDQLRAADGALATFGFSMDEARRLIDEARRAFPGDHGISTFFDVGDLGRRAEHAAARAAHSVPDDSALAETAAAAMALIERVHIAAGRP